MRQKSARAGSSSAIIPGGGLKALMALAVVSLILAACSSTTPTPTATPTAAPAPAIEGPFIGAINVGNVAEAIAAFADDAVLEGFGLCAATPCKGKAAIQKEAERLVADKTRATSISGARSSTGNTSTNRFEFRSDSIKAAGVERIIVAATAERKDGKFALLRWVPEATDAQTATYLKSLGR